MTTNEMTLDAAIIQGPTNTEKPNSIDPSNVESKSSAANEIDQNDVAESNDTNNVRLSVARLTIVLASMWVRRTFFLSRTKMLMPYRQEYSLLF